jgi:hypothetical protein
MKRWRGKHSLGLIDPRSPRRQTQHRPRVRADQANPAVATELDEDGERCSYDDAV